MESKLVFYFINLIKIKRKEKGLSLENVSVLSSMDKGYLSKIENRIVFPSLENLANILEKLGVNLVYEESILKEMNEKLNKLYYDIVYLNSLDHEYINESILADEEIYTSSLIADRYLVIKYAYLVTSNSDKRVFSSLEEEIECSFVQKNILDSNLLQIYYDYKGIALKNSHRLAEAIEMFERSKSIGYFKYSYGIVCYHLAIIYNRQNNHLEAYSNSKESLMIFLQELNFKRQRYSQIHIANIYSESKLYAKADGLYRDLLRCDLDNEFRCLVQLNLIWNLIKQQQFSNAIVELLSINEKTKLKMKWYYFLSWCYYKTNQIEKSAKIIEESESINLSDTINKSKIKVIWLLIRETDCKIKLNLIKNEYQKNLVNMDNEDERFYLEILIEEYSKTGYYKEANKYFNRLIEL